MLKHGNAGSKHRTNTTEESVTDITGEPANLSQRGETNRSRGILQPPQ